MTTSRILTRGVRPVSGMLVTCLPPVPWSDAPSGRPSHRAAVTASDLSWLLRAALKGGCLFGYRRVPRRR
ncbi:hypothetical protein GCM10018793_38030 [Streptomyces sulfonofaciens]|uniref:Uncharacterized protein n=1 Tax=Streptomyces sulfonofaciens TaxID=68272 RepID=A0A919GAF1_9ACTN|nr:hypothetical protein GCM10018793_38030 [Streptomyces sulfonofaciens]